MDKVKKFLEGYVQWLAVALGAAFLGYTVYFFILQKPVSVPKVGVTTDVPPADVDRYVWDGPGQTLRAALDSKVAAPVPNMKPNLTEIAANEFNKPKDTVVLNKQWIPLGLTPVMGDEQNTHQGDNEKLKVTILPVIPPLKNLLMSNGHSNVPAPVMAAGQGQAQLAGQNALDKNWQSVEAVVPCVAIAKAFADAKIPPALMNTCMLRVVMVREEKNRDQTWGAPTTIPALETNVMMDLPDNTADGNSQAAYKAWAEGNTLLICQPPFYQVLQGDIWYEPGTTNPNQVNNALVDDGFDPNHPELFKGDPNLLTPQHKQEYLDYLKHKAALDKAKAQQVRQPPNTGLPSQGGQSPPGNGNTGGGNGNGGGGGGGGGGRGRRLAYDPQRGNPGDNLRPPPAPGMGPGEMMMPPAQGGNQPGAPTPISTVAAAAGLPVGSFDPSQLTDFKVWAHDATAQSGHIYRYMMKYVVTSPVWLSTNLCSPQKLADQFSIESADSVWTDSVNVESDTNFYAVETKGHGIHFHIFKWKDGVWQMQDVQQATDGDMIGSLETSPTGVKTDFSTGWTLVDVRDDPRDDTNKIIVLVSENGTVKRKELNIDQRSFEYHHLYQEALKSRPAAAAAGPGGPNG